MRILGLLLVCAGSFAAIAQTPPTDVDLKSAYCARVVRQQLDKLQPLMGDPEGSPAYAVTHKLLREQTDALNRLQSYLLPKLQTLDPDPLIAAAVRADRDLLELDGVSAECSSSCKSYMQKGAPQGGWSACMDRCLDSPLVKRVRACRNPDWLPF